MLSSMATLTFDTLKFAERLIAAGVPDAHAKAEAAALSEVLEINLKDVEPKTTWTTSWPRSRLI